MEDHNLYFKKEKIKSSHFFSEIQSGFDDLYSGKENMIEKLFKNERKIGEITDDIYTMVYGDLYRQILLEKRAECILYLFINIASKIQDRDTFKKLTTKKIRNSYLSDTRVISDDLSFSVNKSLINKSVNPIIETNEKNKINQNYNNIVNKSSINEQNNNIPQNTGNLIIIYIK